MEQVPRLLITLSDQVLTTDLNFCPALKVVTVGTALKLFA